MSEEQEVQEMVDAMFDEYMANGFDFTSDMTFDEVFKTIFSDAIMIALAAFEEESDLEEETE